MADNRKLAAGLRNLPASAREDLAGREQDIQRGKTVELLRRAGKEMYENPIVNTAVGLSPVLGDIQAAGETMAALGRGAPWQETAGYAAGMLPFMPMIGKTVWHGSPHTFDKFDLSKIGTGEGAQAYGHGLYLAESPDVAGSYRTAGDMGWYEREADKLMFNNDIDAAIKSAKQDLDYVKNNPKAPQSTVDESQKILNVLEARKSGAKEYGQLYKVDLPDEQIAKMLDWDKPIGQQEEAVKESLKPLLENWYGKQSLDYVLNNQDITAKEFLLDLGLDNKTSQKLLEHGIPGIQYLDQASRGAGEGTRNYVVFSDEIPQILERNNQPVAQALREYRGAHTAPGPEFGAQLHDVTGGGAMYPEDIYSARGAHIYGMGGPDVAMDKETMRIIHNMRNKPEEMVDIYRAVPNQADISAINAGDWITINPNYAKMHGESNLPEGYKILQQKVPAKSVWTNADSIHEYGYWPE